jgi:type I restriction enzyme S subunit
VRPGDVLMNIVGPPLGKVALVTDEYPEWNVNQAIAIFRPLPSFDSRFIMIVLSSSTTIAEVLKDTRGVVGQDNLSLEQVRGLRIPLLPITHQRRIVAKVDELTALSDQLETRLTTTRTDMRRLLDAVLQQVLSPTPTH